MEELRSCRNEKMLVETLKSLPKDLETSYDRILDRVKSEDVPDIKTLLLWLVLGMRPLALEELATVVTFDPSSGRFDPSLALFHPDCVIQLCSSLVTKGQDNTVRLAHASVKEYFLAKPRAWHDKWIIFPETRIGHGLIAYCCVKYLLQDGWNRNSTGFPLLKYASQFWPDHYSLSNKNLPLHDTVMEFFKAEQAFFMEWVKMHGDTSWIHYNYHTELPLHYATFFGQEDIIKKLTIHDKDLVEYSKSVHIAAMMGYTGITEFFIDKVLETNPHGQRYDDAMQAKSVEDFMKVLLKWESINFYYDGGAASGSYGNALQAAPHDDHIQVVMHHLNNPVGNALTIASNNGYTEIVKLLLNKGADVNSGGGECLQAASSMGHIEIVNVLLDKGADVNSQGGRYGNALQAASSMGHIEIVKLLLDKGADVNSLDGGYDNALQVASLMGHIEIVKLLLDKGADVNSQHGEHGNALQAASSMGDIEIVKLL